MLEKLIHENQKGFLSGRYIGENIRLVYDILSYTEQHNKPGILLLIDFEKAFDSLSWRFLFNVINFFNFGPDFTKWIKIILNDTKLCVIQNGIFSSFFNIGRGCRQGDPISPYLFLLCVEIMAILIRKNQNIKGICINDKEHKLFQYADDTGIFLDGSENSLKNALDLLDQFSKYSGLTPNFEKTKCIWIGSARGRHLNLCEERHLEWTNEPFIVLGVLFSTELKLIPSLNFNDRLTDIEKAIAQWNKRNLSVLGKVTVVKTILLSKITHLLISLPSPGTNFIKKLEHILFNYVWGGKTDRISRNKMIKDYKDGGCRMVHLDSFIKSLKLTWMRRIFSSESSWKYLFFAMFKTDQTKLETFGNSYSKVISKRFKNDFWNEVLSISFEFSKIVNNQTNDNILSSPLWYNDCIIVDGSPIFYKCMHDHGIKFVSDLVDSKGNFYSYQSLCNTYNIQISILTYLGLRNSIMHSWPQLNTLNCNIFFPFVPSIVRIYKNNRKGTHIFIIHLFQK